MRSRLFLAALPLLLAAGCGGSPKAAPAAKETPATVAKPAKEDDLGTIVLKPEAETRLGLKTVAAETKAVPRSRTYAGDVIVPPGRLIVVASPFPAKVAADGTPPVPGQAVKKGQALVTLLPTLSADALTQYATQKIDADGQVVQARKQVEVNKLQLDRVQKLRTSNNIGAGALEDAQNALSLATTALKNAEARRDDLDRTLREAGAGSVKPQVLAAPEDGILRTVQVAPGQQVGVGAALFEVERLDPIWVRVPVYVGDLKSIAADKPARVGGLNGRTADDAAVAEPADAPPSGDPLAATVDLFYELPNPRSALRPGQRLGVSVPLVGASEGLVIPASALYYDIQGGTWVYEQIKDHTFVRRRVEVEQVADGSAIIARGLKPGAKIVTVAVAELYGTEFGFAK